MGGLRWESYANFSVIPFLSIFIFVNPFFLLIPFVSDGGWKNGRKKDLLISKLHSANSHKAWPDDERYGEIIGEKEKEKGRVKLGEKRREWEKNKLSFWR